MDLINDRLRDLLDYVNHCDPVFRTQMGAAIYIRNKLIVVGSNSYKTHPFQAKFGKCREAIYLHAEVNVIKESLKKVSVCDLKKASLYIARLKWTNAGKRKKVQGLAKPCEGCQRAIATFGIEEVFYTLDNEGYDML